MIMANKDKAKKEPKKPKKDKKLPFMPMPTKKC
jgi:hypothetical protein